MKLLSSFFIYSSKLLLARLIQEFKYKVIYYVEVENKIIIHNNVHLEKNCFSGKYMAFYKINHI